MPLNKPAIVHLIQSAFRDVRLGDGIGLYEGQGLDQYSGAATIAEYRSKDERIDWSRISTEDLKNCYSSLSFFDAPGMRFHLPAYLIADLEGKINVDVLFHLIYQEDGALSRFALLSPAQRRAVREYLLLMRKRICSTSPSDMQDPLVESIDNALDRYWTE